MLKKMAIVVAVMILVSGIALAQEKKMSNEEDQTKIKSSMRMMTPLFGQMTKAMMEAQLEVLANPATAEKLAIYTKNYYDALIKKGFSKEDALRLAMAVGFPSLSSTQK